MDIEWNKMIKSHLNSSLEIEGITVSEDLIQRTLMRIREQSDKEQIDKIEEEQIITETGHRKIVTNPWIRRLVPTIAAAALLLFIGLNPNGMQKNEYLGKTSSSESSAPKAQLEMKMDSAYNDNIAEQETAVALQENSIAAMEGNAQTTEEAMDTNELMGVTMSPTDAGSGTLDRQSDIYPLSFADINPITLNTATSIDITEAASNNSLFLSSKEDMKEFFDILNQYRFAEGSKVGRSDKFIIRIAGDGAIFTIEMDEGYINTSFLRGEEKVDGRYEAFDHLVLLAELEQLYLRLNQ